ncbi:MAG: mechanosensitive ion channel [Anaerolineales bacterium]|nr:mechanosensitive ion channel [Anaerolineales bacterium]
MENLIENIMTVLENWWQGFIENLPGLIAGLVIFLLSLYLARVLSRAVRRMMKRRAEDEELTVLITRLVRWSVIVLGIILALEQAGKDVSAFLTGLGILGFTVGFALQDISANLVSGILLLFEQPFDIGDSISVADYSGTVRTINLRATEILTWDGLLVLIPNREVFTNSITNYTRITQRRIGLSVGVGYDSDLQQVEQIAIKAVKKLPGVKEDPAPFFMVDSFGDSAINATVYYWYDTQNNDLAELTNNGAVAVKQAFDQAGIEMPYPIRSVRLEKMPE